MTYLTDRSVIASFLSLIMQQDTSRATVFARYYGGTTKKTTFADKVMDDSPPLLR